MIPRAHISHEIPERARIRIPSERNRRGYFARLERELGKIEGVESVRVQPLTASVLVRHRGALQKLIEHARRRGLFDVRKPKPVEPLVNQVFAKLENWDREIIEGSEGLWDLSSAAALTVVGIGVFQVLRQELFPPAWTLLGDAALLLARSRRIRHQPRKAAA